MDGVLIIHAFRIRLAGYLLLAALCAAPCLFLVRVMGHLPLAKVLGYGGGLFLLPAAMFYFIEFVRGGIRARIGPAGIEDRVLGVGLIPWADIEDVDLAVTSAAGSLVITLRNEDEWVRRMPLTSRAWAEFNRLVRHPRCAVNLAGSGVNRFEVLAAALEFKDGKAA